MAQRTGNLESLGKAAAILLHTMSPASRRIRPRVQWANAESWATDGTTAIVMTPTFCGTDLTLPGNVERAIGHLAHELGHWCQPMAALAEAEADSCPPLDHTIVNLIADHNADCNVARLIPSIGHALDSRKQSIPDAERNEWFRQIETSTNPRDVAAAALLAGKWESGGMSANGIRNRAGDICDLYACNLPAKTRRELAKWLSATIAAAAIRPPDALPAVIRKAAESCPWAGEPESGNGEQESGNGEQESDNDQNGDSGGGGNVGDSDDSGNSGNDSSDRESTRDDNLETEAEPESGDESGEPESGEPESETENGQNGDPIGQNDGGRDCNPDSSGNDNNARRVDCSTVQDGDCIPDSTNNNPGNLNDPEATMATIPYNSPVAVPVPPYAATFYTAAESPYTYTRQPARTDAQSIARRLAPRFVTKSGSVTIAAPGQVDRQAIKRVDNPMPYKMTLAGNQAGGMAALIAIDGSGSMGSYMGGQWNQPTKWEAAELAAQALAIAIQSAGGIVASAIFGGDCIHSATDELLYTAAGTTRCDQWHTSGAWLPLLWATYPNHWICILTDGELQEIPEYIPATDKARTTCLVIPDGDEYAPESWAHSVLSVNRADELPRIMAMAIPRSLQA
jgi:hypothetical protein